MPVKSIRNSVVFYRKADKQGDPVPVLPSQGFPEDAGNGMTYYARLSHLRVLGLKANELKFNGIGS